MKPRELMYLLGFRPRPKTWPFEVVTFNLPEDGEVRYAQWLHPRESRKSIRQEAVDELRRYITPGDVAIDIGAHTGDTTLPMALAAGPDGHVLALEPNARVFPVLEKNAQLNPGKAVITPLMLAATAEPGEYWFEYSDAGYCNGGLHAGTSRWRHGHAFKLRVRGVNLDHYLAEHHPAMVERLRYLKVDAEGYDYQILASLRPLLVARKPFIRAEVFKLLKRRQRERLYDFLVGLDYEVHVMDSDVHHEGARLDRADLMVRRHYDIFCIPA